MVGIARYRTDFWIYATAAGLGASPGVAFAQSSPALGDPSLVFLLWSVALVLVAAAAVAAAVHARRRLHAALGERDARAAEAQGLADALDAVPDGFVVWSKPGAAPRTSAGLGGIVGLRPGRGFDEDRIAECFRAADADALRDALARLRGGGQAFDLTLGLAADERAVQVSGRRAGGGVPGAVLRFRDVTAPTAALAEAERRRRDLAARLDSLPWPVWARDGDLALAYCNAAYARAVDAAPDEAVARQIEIAGGALAEAGKAVARRARDLGVAQSESRHVVIGGDRRLFDFVEQPLADGGLVGYALDMTDLEDVQSELARHVSAHAEVLGHLGTGIVIFGPDQRVKFFNNAYLDLFGLDEGFLNGEPTMAEVLETLRERRRLPEFADFPAYKRDRVRQLMGVIAPLEELIHLPDGMTLRLVAAPHPFGGIVMTFEDVTARLELERKYNTLIEVQRDTLDNLYEGIAVYGGDGRLKLSNPAFARIWGLSPADLENQPHLAAVVERTRHLYGAADDWEAVRDEIVARVADRTGRSGRLERPDGTVLDYATVPLPDGGCLFTYLDVTDSFRVQQALRERNAALETADLLKSEFIANVSYELRTPLNAIIGFAEILDLQYFGPLNERQVEYSRGIVEASQRLLSLINDILDIATIDAGYMQIDLLPVDVKSVLAALKALAGERARNRELALEVDCPADIGTVPADERRLKQAVYNLISNAIKFTPEGGRVTVSARRGDDELLISVTDTGIGIPAADQAAVFGKFARVGGQVRQSGAGLGLALVKSLIELHGGRVELDSTPGAGTRVTCHLPTRAATDAEAAGPENSKRIAGAGR
ncbi:MAG: PAS-domain containing protein [Dongiaceae bacterium]